MFTGKGTHDDTAPKYLQQNPTAAQPRWSLSSAPSQGGNDDQGGQNGNGSLQEPEEESEEEEAADGYLMAGAGAKKRKVEKKRRCKRSKEDLLNDDVEKMEKDAQLLFNNLCNWPEKPTGVDIGKVMRGLNTKLKLMRDSSAFDNAQRLEELIVQIDLLKECTSAASKYLPSRGLPIKKYRENFYQVFEKCEQTAPHIVANFPKVVLQHFMDAALEIDIDQESWGKVAEKLSRRKLEKIYEDNADVVQKKAVAGMEQVLSKIMGMDVDNAGTALETACVAILGESPPDSLESHLPLLVQLASRTPVGTGTLDGLLTEFHDQANKPLFRAIMQCQTGKDLIAKAEEQNEKYRDFASKQTTLRELQDSGCSLQGRMI